MLCRACLDCLKGIVVDTRLDMHTPMPFKESCATLKTRGHSPGKNQERTMIIMATAIKVDGRTKAARAAKAAVPAPAKRAPLRGNGDKSTVMTHSKDTKGTHVFVNPDPGSPILTLYVQKGD